MHISKDQFANIRHMLENRFGNSLQQETMPHYRFDDKMKEGVINGTIYTFIFQQQGKEFKVEIIEKEKIIEHEKMKEGRVVGRRFETIPGQHTYSLDLFQKRDEEWTKMDLDIGDLFE